METIELLDLLHAYKQGSIKEETILHKIQTNSQGFEDIGFAKIDHNRTQRQGFS